MDPGECYRMLQRFASPLVAVTTRHGATVNGMVANSAGRASLVPERPRLSFYCFKNHYTHELIGQSGRFCLHLLHRGQFKTVRALGFVSGRDHNKMDRLPWRSSGHDLPVLDVHFAYFECEVVNAMDAGPSTFFLGEVLEARKHPGAKDMLVMDSDYFRENMPDSWRTLYEQNKRRVQQWAREHLEVDPTKGWEGA